MMLFKVTIILAKSQGNVELMYTDNPTDLFAAACPSEATDSFGKTIYIAECPAAIVIQNLALQLAGQLELAELQQTVQAEFEQRQSGKAQIIKPFFTSGKAM
jgi:hypothetical protein